MNEPPVPSDAQAGVIPPEALRTLSGLDILRGLRDGTLPPPPMGRLLGFGLEEVEEGRVVFAAVPGGQHYNPIGTVHGGFAATLLDSCMACAVQSTLARGFGYTTLELKVNLVRAMTEDTGPVRAEGRVLHAGRRVATAEGRLTDAAGRLLAHGTTTCLVIEF